MFADFRGQGTAVRLPFSGLVPVRLNGFTTKGIAGRSQGRTSAWQKKVGNGPTTGERQ